MLESIEKLREWAQMFGPMGSHDPMMFADEIEAEIAENFMELPKDAEGVPIRYGDTVTGETWDNGEFAVFAVARDYWVDIDGFTHRPCETHHIKHDPLRERARELLRDYRGLNLKAPDSKLDTMLDAFCADVRDLMEVDR